MPTYVVLNGKHWKTESGKQVAYPKGSKVELAEEVAASFPGRFRLVAESEPDPEPEEKAPARKK